MRAHVGLVLAVCVSSCAPTVPLNQLDEEIIRAFCKRDAQCHVAYSEEVCVKLRTEQGLNITNNAAIEAGRIRYDGAAARRCLDIAVQDSCDVLLSGRANQDSSCKSIFAGTLGAGQTCHTGECTGGFYCSADVDYRCPGTCFPRLGEGERANQGFQCAEGLVLGGGGVCSKPLPAGATCKGSFGCEPGLYCSTSETCTAPAGVGASCSADLLCSSELVCQDGTCRIPPGLGEPCAQVRHDCQFGLHCDLTVHCALPGVADAACRLDGDCESPLGCGLSSSCQPRVGVAQSCASAPCETTAYCDSSHVCQERIPLGSPCPAGTGGRSCVPGAECVFEVCVRAPTLTCR